MLYDWAVSLSMDRGLSGVLTTYAIVDFNFDYDAWCAWDCNRLSPAQNIDNTTGVTMDPASAVYARWQERRQIHKTQFHDFEVLALLQTWEIENSFPAWHLLPQEQRVLLCMEHFNLSSLAMALLHGMMEPATAYFQSSIIRPKGISTGKLYDTLPSYHSVPNWILTIITLHLSLPTL